MEWGCVYLWFGEDVLPEVEAIDIRPDSPGRDDGFLLGEVGKAAEIGVGVAEGGVAQREEPRHVPVLHVLLVCVDIDGEVEEVGHERPQAAPTGTVGRLEDV